MKGSLIWLLCTILAIQKVFCNKNSQEIPEKLTALAQTASTSMMMDSSSSASNALTDAIESMRHWRTLNDPGALKEKRTVLFVLAALVVLLYWIVLTQFALPASKSANIELRTAELDAKMSDFEKLVYHNQMKKKEKIASDLN